MKKLTLALALLPALGLAAQQTSPARGGAGAADDASRLAQMQKRMRLARTLGLAEALDLDDAGAMRARDVLARFDDRRVPLRKQVRDGVRVLQDAARGDKDALPQVDPALQKIRDARTQLQNLNTEMFEQLTKGLSPDKKARAALFLARFHEREHRIFIRQPGFPGHGGRGAMMMEGGPHEGMGPPPPGPVMFERQKMVMGEMPGPDTDEWLDDEP
jgi:hypothetical protein